MTSDPAHPSEVAGAVPPPAPTPVPSPAPTPVRTPAATRPVREVVGHVATQAVAGAVAGAVATVPMSALMLLAQRLGLMGTQPPRRITDGALDAVDAHPPEGGRRALTALAHVGFGAAAGAPFPLLHRALSPGAPRPLVGVVYALGVWASAYLGWVPAAGLMPPAHRDRRGRPASMVAAHVVYGAVLGAATARLLRRHGTGPSTSPVP